MWHKTHSRECPVLRRQYKQYALVIAPTPSGEAPPASFRRPVDVRAGEKFTVKVVQRTEGDGDGLLLVTDQTGHCEFELGRDQKFHRRLLAKVQAEDATGGTKTFMEAAFDKKGHCKLYLNRTRLRTW